MPQWAQKDTPYAGEASIEETKRMCAARSSSLKLFQRMLRCIVQLHGGKLVKRWRRKTKRQRQETIRKFEPNICPQDFPGERSWFNMFDKDLTKDWNHDCDYMTAAIPYLNLESLSHDSFRFLSLVYQRVKHDPWEFAVHDARELLAAWMSGTIRPKFHQGCVGMTAKTYGRWSEVDLAKIHRGNFFSASKAQLVFQAQATIMVFLIGLSSHLLSDSLPAFNRDYSNAHDLENYLRTVGTEIDMQFDYLGQSQLEGLHALENYVHNSSSGHPQGRWPSFLTRHRLRPFMEPYKISYEHLITLARDRVAEAQDQLWLLQTDPGSLLRHLRAIETSWQRLRALNMNGQKSFEWEGIFASALWLPLGLYVEWKSLLDELVFLRDEHKKHAGKIRPGNVLPTDYDNAVGCLRVLIRGLQSQYRTQIKEKLIFNPTFTRSFKYFEAGSKGNRAGRADTVRVDKAKFQAINEDKVFGLLLYVTMEDRNTIQISLTAALHFLEEALVSRSETMATCLDPANYGYLSDLAILEEFAIAIELHRPTPRVLLLSDDHDNPRSFWTLHRTMKDKFGDDPPAPVGLEAVAAVLRPINKLAIPLKVRTEKWVHQSQRAHEVLRRSWEVVEDALIKYLEITDCPEDRRLRYVEALGYYKDPSYLASVEAEHVQVLQDVREENQLVSQQHLTLQPEPKEKVFGIHRQKPKTKAAVPASEDGTTTPGPIATNPVPPGEAIPELYHLESSHTRLIDQLFGTSDKNAVRTPEDWKAFETFMTDAGFGMERCGGSMVRFEGTIALEEAGEKVEKHRSIMIHRPHPGNEMAPEMLSDIGRRLARRFGWTRQHFAEV